MRPRHVLSAVLVALGVTSTRHGSAQEQEEAPAPPERPSPPAPPRDPNLPYLFEVGGRTGYTTVPIRGGVNPFGAGFGGRLGFNVAGIYLGASMMDYMGGADVGATDSSWLFAGDFGYGFRIGPYVTIRPLVAVGDVLLIHTEPPARGLDVVTSASGTVSGGGGGVQTTVNNVFVQPGVTTLLATRNYFCGVGFNALVVPGILYGPAPAQQTTWISYSFEGQLGFRL